MRISPRRTLHILSAPIPSLHTEAILPYEDDSAVTYSQSPFSGDLGIPGALRGREWHGSVVWRQHLVVHMPLEGVVQQ